MLLPVALFLRYLSLRLVVDATFLEGMFLVLLGSTFSVSSLLVPKARRWRKIGLELIALALATFIFTVIVGEGFIRLR
jgi:hypothetical protein